MACHEFHERIIGRLYGEIADEAHAALDAHLAGCAACRTDLDELSRVRDAVRECEPPVPIAPRLVVLRERPTVRPALLAASILGAALVAGASAGGGYALLRNHGNGGAVAPPVATGVARTPVAQGPSATTASLPSTTASTDAPGRESASAARQAATPAARPLTREEIDAALARFERRVDAGRATDLRYMMTQLAASEVRSGQRIGQTNEALRYVALASNPGMGVR